MRTQNKEKKMQNRTKKRREKEKVLQNVLLNTSASTPPPSSPRARLLTPESSTAGMGGSKQVRRDRSKRQETVEKYLNFWILNVSNVMFELIIENCSNS